MASTWQTGLTSDLASKEEVLAYSSGAPTLLVIFGGTGDLAHRKLLPAVYNLCYEALQTGQPLPFEVLAIGRRDWTDEDYRASVNGWVETFSRKPYTAELGALFQKHVFYQALDLEDSEGYAALFERFAQQWPESPRLYYYAVAPRFFAPISRALGQYPDQAKQARLIIEKPFGETLQQAKQLYEEMCTVFGAERIFHIDHYLGKEMIQNILTLRFENKLFESTWDHRSIEAVEITAAETVGVETRGGYYDRSGAMRDMMQNHLFQILSILAMEKPADDRLESLAEAQAALLDTLRPVGEDWDQHFVAGQYEGYRTEAQVAADSRTETYAAVAVHVDHPRWQGVPFLIRTGKKLGARGTFIVIRYRSTPGAQQPNTLRIEIQPQEGIHVRFNIKKPGLTDAIEPVEMTFCQSCRVDAHENTPEAYERLLRYAAEGRQSLFSQWPQIEKSWRWIDDLMARWEAAGRPLASYVPGGDGPSAADQMAQAHGLHWEALEASLS